MSAWWSYRPSDFLLYAPRTYYRLVELANQEVWPLQVVALAAVLAAAWAAWRNPPRATPAIALVLAASWAAAAGWFNARHYATINWAAVWYAVAFGLQAILLAAAATLPGRLAWGERGARAATGLALVGVAVLLQPLIALQLGRPWSQVETAGLFPDPTVLATLGLLTAARRAPWWLWPVPVAWCALAGLTLWTMEAVDWIVPPLVAAIALTARLRRPVRTP